MQVTPDVAAPFDVTLTVPAPPGGVTVTLKSSDTSKVTVAPDSVVIPQGATTPVTQPQVTGVGIGTATITAAATGYTPGTGAVTVSAPTMAFTGAPLVIAIGGTGNLTLSLTGGQAPAGGLTVSLSSSNTGNATVPGTVSFAAGAVSAVVTVTGAAAGAATITASAPNIANATAGVTVTPPPTVTAAYSTNFLQTINVVLTNTSAVTAVNLRITSVTNITAAAPNVIALTPNNVLPESLGNLQGGKAVLGGFLFQATAGSIEVPFSFTITYLADNMPPQTAVISVPFPRAMSFSGSPLAINAGATGNLTLNLTGNQAPPGGLVVALSSSDPARATVPPTVTVPAGATSVIVPVAGLAPGSAVITANATIVNFPATATATVNVTAAISVPGNTTVGLGRAVPFAVTLPAPAPPGGVAVKLKSSDPSRVTVTPDSVVIPQGATTPATQPQVTGSGIGSATITADAAGFTTGTGAVTVTAPTMAFTGAPLAVTIGGTGNLTLSLTGGQAPAGGLTVNVSCSDTGKATVPGTVSFAAGAVSAVVTVTGVAAGTATITASAPNIANATAGVTVTPPPTVTAAYSTNFLQAINVVLTNTSAVTAVNLRITSVTNITAAAPNVVALLANNVFPESLGNLQGGKAVLGGFLFQATAGSIEVPFTFTITYQADNMPPQTAVISVPFPRAMSFSGSPLAINAGASGNLTLNLTGNQAPAGGLTVTLSSSDPTRATVPATVTVPAGGTSVSVPVAGVAPGTAVITANATVVNFPATATATVNVTAAIIVPASTTVALGQSAPFALTLPAPAAAGGVTVKLKSSDPAKVTVTPASVVIPQGATFSRTQLLVTGAGIGSATITADAAGYTAGTASVTVTPPPVVTAAYGANFLQAINLVLSNSSAVTAVNLRITNVTNITAAAPNVIAQPSQVPFPWPLGDLPGGQTKAWTMQFVATAGSISVPFSFTVTYQADNMPPQTAVINVPFPRAMSFSGSPLGISAGTSGKLTLNLTGNQAPPAGLTVTLSSSAPSRATVPPTVSFAPGATSVSVPVAGITPGSAVITANATVVNFPATATATVNVGGIVGPPNTGAVGKGEAQ